MTNLYQPLHDRVLIQLPPEGTDERLSPSGIVIIQRAEEAPNACIKSGIVLAVGDGEVLFDGTVRTLAVKVGQRVLFHVNEALVIEEAADPTQPTLAILSERVLLAIVAG